MAKSKFERRDRETNKNSFSNLVKQTKCGEELKFSTYAALKISKYTAFIYPHKYHKQG